MTLRIGRVAFGDDERTRVGSLSFSGDTLSLNGEIKAVDQAKASAEMQRINGLIEAKDEPVVPVTWPDGPPDVSGFYRVTGGRIDGIGGYMPNGRANFDLQLTRVSGFAAPMFESIVLGGKRTDASESVTHQAAIGLPSATRGFEIGADLTPSSFSRSSARGDVILFHNAANTLDRATPAFYVPPEDWYDGAVSLTVGGELVTGRQVRNLPQDWRLDNGLIRLSAATLSDIAVERFASSTWGTLGTLQPGMQAGPGAALGDLPAPHTLTVVQNGPEVVKIRLTYDLQSIVTTGRFAVTLDIGLRRGAALASFRMHSRGDYGYRVDVVGWGLTENNRTLTGGLWTTLTRAVMCHDRQLSANTAAAGKPTGTRRFYRLTGSALSWGFGYSSSSDEGQEFDHPQSIVNQWAADHSEYINAVVR